MPGFVNYRLGHSGAISHSDHIVIGQDASTESAVEHASSIIEGEHSIASDIVVLLQPTSPLRKPEAIDIAVEQFVREKAARLFAAARVDDLLLWGLGGVDWRRSG